MRTSDKLKMFSKHYVPAWRHPLRHLDSLAQEQIQFATIKVNNKQVRRADEERYAQIIRFRGQCPLLQSTLPKNLVH